MNEISSGVEQFCQCPFPSDLIIYERLTCVGEETHVVVFQGWINSSNATHLAGLLEEWASSEPTVVVQDNKLQVGILSFESQPAPDKQAALSHVVLGVILAASVLVLLTGAAVVVCCVVLHCKRYTLCKKSMSIHFHVYIRVFKPFKVSEHL